jgi:membrane protease YdiL (CAAX protease family)
MERRILGVDLKIFGLLLLGSIVGIICVIPYSLTIQKPILEKTPLSIPLYVLIPMQVAFNAMLYAFFIFIGLLAARKTTLGTPLLDSWLERKPFEMKRMLLFAIPLGVLAAITIIVLDVYWFGPRMPLPAMGFENPPVWQGFLASFEGGITEEVLLRLFLMSLFVWVFTLIKKGNWAYWVSIFLTSLLFGAGHLPTAAMIWHLTGVVIARTIVLNGLAGLVFGWLYWKYGLESAMVAHFSADIVLHVIMPMVTG